MEQVKQTAVEWYEIEINSLIEKYESKEISKKDFITMKHNLFYDAKAMEKEQIIKFANDYLDDDADLTAEQYYKENYGKS